MPHDFLDSIWSPCDNRGSEHLAPSIHATVTHFNRVVECVSPSIQRSKKTWRQVARWVGLFPCEHHVGEPDTPNRVAIAPQSAGTSWETVNPGDRV
ncbi:hypothetical protein HPG69_008185 [Diceros bicornis minor]|uniref:Uncharacterized protein n=1 Tax=Diceros bicornis minor TaxID=77932 RepID=A0A7J7E859_DICBM|nr:hypothetical protein HPG69_008185 [Diceros bicornis minor]